MGRLIPSEGNPEEHNMEKGAEYWFAFNTLYFLTAGALWPPALSSCCLYFLTMMDCTLELWTIIRPFSFKLPMSVFFFLKNPSNRKEIKTLTIKETIFPYFSSPHFPFSFSSGFCYFWSGTHCEPQADLELRAILLLHYSEFWDDSMHCHVYFLLRTLSLLFVT